MNEGAVVQQDTPLVSGSIEVPSFNRDALIKVIRADQKGENTFHEFLQSTWGAGVIGYDVDFTARTVIYYGANNESYLEEYPAVNL